MSEEEEEIVSGYKWIYFIIAAALLTFMFLYLYTAFAEYQTGKLECTDDSIGAIMIAKVQYAPCFTYYDSALQRYIPGTIDMDKFTQGTFDACFIYLTKRANISVDGKSVGQEIFEPKIINKTVWVYTGAEKKPSTIQFQFEESQC